MTRTTGESHVTNMVLDTIRAFDVDRQPSHVGGAPGNYVITYNQETKV